MNDLNQKLTLAERARPTTIEQIRGQQHLLSEGKPLRMAFNKSLVHSMILWGPPATGKTTIARLLAKQHQFQFLALSAVLDNIQKVREAIKQAKNNRQQQTILFIDEVHRFNKSQQDAFLPHIENGTIIFIGATTENPSFEVNRALLSRLKIYLLNPLNDQALLESLNYAISIVEKEQQTNLDINDQNKELLILSCNRDVRRLLNTFELALQLQEPSEKSKTITLDKNNVIEAIGSHNSHHFDKGGDIWYDQISALHKSVRGSSPDGALYWYTRMISAGCDPLYIARRLLAIASEDIGNADPSALTLALSAWQTYERLGAYEGERAIAHACIYLAAAPKSNSIDSAFKQVKKFIQESEDFAVPVHLRNAPTKLLKELGHGKEYRYAHNEPNGYAAGENYLPEEIKDKQFYVPKESGIEQKISDKLKKLKQLDQQSRQKRYD